MAYETGVATDVIDLLAKIRSLADDLGWTIDRHDPAELALHHADAGYFTLRATPEEDDIQTNWDPGPSISIWGHTGFDAGAAHNAQPGSSGGEYGRTNALAQHRPVAGAHHGAHSWAKPIPLKPPHYRTIDLVAEPTVQTTKALLFRTMRKNQIRIIQKV